MDRLLDGHPDGDDQTAGAARRAGVDLRPPFGLLVALRGRDGPEDALDTHAAWFAAALQGVVAGRVRPEPWPHAVVLAPGASGARWADLLATADVVSRKAGLVALATRAPALAGVAAAYAESLAALHAARLRPAGVAHPSHTVVDALLASLPPAARRAHVASTVGSLQDLDDGFGDELLATIAAYYDTGRSGRAAAERVHVHAQTVHQRLRTVRDLTGFDPRDPEGALALRLAVRLLRLDGVLPPGRGAVVRR